MAESSCEKLYSGYTQSRTKLRSTPNQKLPNPCGLSQKPPAFPLLFSAGKESRAFLLEKHDRWNIPLGRLSGFRL